MKSLKVPFSRDLFLFITNRYWDKGDAVNGVDKTITEILLFMEKI
jgi:hypothetical protein